MREVRSSSVVNRRRFHAGHRGSPAAGHRKLSQGIARPRDSAGAKPSLGTVMAQDREALGVDLDTEIEIEIDKERQMPSGSRSS